MFFSKALQGLKVNVWMIFIFQLLMEIACFFQVFFRLPDQGGTKRDPCTDLLARRSFRITPDRTVEIQDPAPVLVGGQKRELRPGNLYSFQVFGSERIGQKNEGLAPDAAFFRHAADKRIDKTGIAVDKLDFSRFQQIGRASCRERV